MHIAYFRRAGYTCALALGLLLSVSETRAQTDRFFPKRNRDMWSADTLYMGAAFARLSTEPVTVWLKANEAGWVGELSVIEPGTGRRVTLFTNHSSQGQLVVISDFVNIPVGAMVTFEYTVVNTMGYEAVLEVDPSVWWPKYTGSNRKGSKYRSRAGSEKNPVTERNPDPTPGDGDKPEDHRWSVMGRVSKDVLEFGFEDNSGNNSDMDFDDIIFQTRGLAMVRVDKAVRNRSYIW